MHVDPALGRKSASETLRVVVVTMDSHLSAAMSRAE